MTQSLKERIRSQALTLGFDACGFAPAEVPARDAQALHDFIEDGWHGTMAWMARRQDERAQPKTLWPDCRSVVVLGVNYGPETSPLQRLTEPERANVSVYAEDKDYHDIIKKRLKAVARWLVAEVDCEVKVFVDTAPVLERALAAQSAVGWQGKHCNLVSRDFGSWLFLGEIYTSLDLSPDAPEADHCGRCNACIDVCPTQAIVAPQKLDARRCISYLTIEHEGSIPVEFRQAMGNRIYGCDDCLAVCPWNKFAKRTEESRFHARDVLANPSIEALLAMDETAFRAAFAGSPIKRIGISRFQRNLCIAAGNSGNQKHLPRLRQLASSDDGVVAEAAAWALEQLLV